MEGQNIEIDFLDHVLGVDDGKLKQQAIQLILNVRLEEGLGELHIPIMHPMHCLQSRLANVITLKRDDEIAKNQLDASPIVLREFLLEKLDAGDTKYVTSVLQSLYEYLIKDIAGRQAHKVMRNDPADILAVFQDDERLDARWREKSLRSMRVTIERRRSAWRAMADRLLSRFSSRTLEPYAG